MNKKTKWGIIALLVIGLTGWGIYSQMPKENEELTAADKATPTSNRGKKTLTVNAVVVKPTRMTDQINISGKLLPDEEVDLAFESAGTIVEINFDEGTYVKKGQLLARVNNQPLQAQLKRLEAGLQLAKDRVFRQSALLERDAVSKEAYEQAKTELATLYADIELVQANIEQTELRAPFDGIIGLRQVSVGTYANTSTTLAKLTKVAPLKVEFAVPERYAADVNPGQTLDFAIEGHLNPFKATVYAREAIIDPITHTLTLRALYPNTRNELMPGRYASITLNKQTEQDAIAIPSEAIIPEMGEDKVYLYKNGTAQPTVIKAGLRTEALVEVTQGLLPGDTVITTGIMQLRTGLPVKLEKID